MGCLGADAVCIGFGTKKGGSLEHISHNCLFLLSSKAGNLSLTNTRELVIFNEFTVSGRSPPFQKTRTFRKNLDSANFTVVQNPSRDIWCITSSHKLKEFTEYCYVLTTCCFPYAWRFLKHILGIFHKKFKISKLPKILY